jgi:hypothetical protein
MLYDICYGDECVECSQKPRNSHVFQQGFGQAMFDRESKALSWYLLYFVEDFNWILIFNARYRYSNIVSILFGEQASVPACEGMAL